MYENKADKFTIFKRSVAISWVLGIIILAVFFTGYDIGFIWVLGGFLVLIYAFCGSMIVLVNFLYEASLKRKAAKVMGKPESQVDFNDGHWFSFSYNQSPDFHEGQFDRNYPVMIEDRYDPHDDDSDREMGRLSHVRITYHEQGSGKEKHFSCSYAPGLAAEMTEFFDKWGIPYQFSEMSESTKQYMEKHQQNK